MFHPPLRMWLMSEFGIDPGSFAALHLPIGALDREAESRFEESYRDAVERFEVCQVDGISLDFFGAAIGEFYGVGVHLFLVFGGAGLLPPALPPAARARAEGGNQAEGWPVARAMAAGIPPTMERKEAMKRYVFIPGNQSELLDKVPKAFRRISDCRNPAY